MHTPPLFVMCTVSWKRKYKNIFANLPFCNKLFPFLCIQWCHYHIGTICTCIPISFPDNLLIYIHMYGDLSCTSNAFRICRLLVSWFSWKNVFQKNVSHCLLQHMRISQVFWNTYWQAISSTASHGWKTCVYGRHRLRRLLLLLYNLHIY